MRHAATLVLCVCLTASGWAGTRLDIDGGRFVVDGTPAFLLGISYYGALGASREAVRADLADMQAAGFNWIRVWATWDNFAAVNALDADGKGREPYLSRLVWLVGECDRRKMVVDVTLHRHRSDDGRRMLPDLLSHLRGVETIVGAFGKHRNWYLDLANERDVRDARRVPFEELAQLRRRARELYPELKVTASGVPHRDDLKDYLVTAKLDFVCPHWSRDPQSPAKTEQRVRELCAWMAELGRTVPIHVQEPFRRGYTDWQPTAQDFLTDLEGARSGGAAGWCFHNGAQRKAPGGRPRRSFDLREKRLFDQLDNEEQQLIRGLRIQKKKLTIP